MSRPYKDGVEDRLKKLELENSLIKTDLQSLKRRHEILNATAKTVPYRLHNESMLVYRSRREYIDEGFTLVSFLEEGQCELWVKSDEKP